MTFKVTQNNYQNGVGQTQTSSGSQTRSTGTTTETCDTTQQGSRTDTVATSQPRLTEYQQQWGGSYSTSYNLPTSQDSAPGDLPDAAPVELSRKPAANTLQTCQQVSDASSDVFAMACAEALQVHQQTNGGDQYSSYLNGFKCQALRVALDGFVKAHQNDQQSSVYSPSGSWNSQLLSAAKQACPAGAQATGSTTVRSVGGTGADQQAQTLRDSLWNFLGKYPNVRQELWNKLEADHLLRSADGSSKTPVNTGDLQALYANMTAEDKVRFRNELYNELQKSSDGQELWGKMDAFRLIPNPGTATGSSTTTNPGTVANPGTVTYPGSTPGSTTLKPITGDAAQQAKALRDNVYNYLSTQSWGKDLWTKLEADDLLPKEDGTQKTAQNKAGDAQSLFANLSADQQKQVRDNLYNILEKAPSGKAIWDNLEGYRLLPPSTGTASSGQYPTQPLPLPVVVNPVQTPVVTPVQTPVVTPVQTPAVTPVQTPIVTPARTPVVGVDVTTWRSQSNPTAKAEYANAAANSANPQTQAAARRAYDGVTKLEQDQSWLNYATAGLAKANAEGSALDANNQAQSASYWQAEQNKVAATFQNDWQSVRKDEGEYWYLAQQTDASKRPQYMAYINNRQFTTEGLMPVGFTSAQLPGGVSTGTTTQPRVTQPAPVIVPSVVGLPTASGNGIITLPPLADKPDWLVNAGQLLADPQGAAHISQGDFQQLTQNFAMLYNQDPNAYWTTLSQGQDPALAGAIAFAVNDTSVYNPKALRTNGADQNTELGQYGTYIAKAKNGDYANWAPQTQNQGGQPALTDVTPDTLFPGSDDAAKAARQVLTAQTPADKNGVNADVFANACVALTALYKASPARYYEAMQKVPDRKARDVMNYAVLDTLSNHTDQYTKDSGKPWFKDLWAKYGHTGFAGTPEVTINHGSTLNAGGPQG